MSKDPLDESRESRLSFHCLPHFFVDQFMEFFSGLGSRELFFGDLDTFDTSTMEGNQAQCPHCGKMTGCNKENMRVRAKDAGFVGKDT